MLDGAVVCVLLGLAEFAVRPPPANAATVAVLFGDHVGLGENTLRSLQYAMSVADPSTHFVVIGGARPDIGYAGACEMRNWFVGHGVSPLRITVGTQSFDTLGNLAELRSQAKSHVVLVADSLHARRIAYILRRDPQPNVEIAAFTLLDGSPANVAAALGRAQYELIAWLLYLTLPDTWYDALLKRLRYNSDLLHRARVRC